MCSQMATDRRGGEKGKSQSRPSPAKKRNTRVLNDLGGGPPGGISHVLLVIFVLRLLPVSSWIVPFRLGLLVFSSFFVAVLHPRSASGSQKGFTCWPHENFWQKKYHLYHDNSVLDSVLLESLISSDTSMITITISRLLRYFTVEFLK